MSFASLRRWLNHPDKPSTQVTSAPSGLGEAQAEAQFLRGQEFASGTGVAQDYTQAAQFWAQAAEQGHSFAQLNLASLYAQGQGVERDEAKALMWLTKAANQGNADAQYRLGVQHHLLCRKASKGTGTESRIEALKWVQLSAAQEHYGARNACEFVALGMTREEVAEGKRRATAFVPVTSA
jgi:hypothetical protein